MRKMTCGHANTTFGADRSFSGSVSVHPFTVENQSAHGCITYPQTCSDCGATRSLNQNQHHVEYGVWTGGAIKEPQYPSAWDSK